MAGRCTQVLQQGKMLFRCPCEAGIFDIAPSYPAGSTFVLLCNSCDHPASDHASVSTDSSLSDEPLRDHRILQQPAVVPQVRGGAPAARLAFFLKVRSITFLLFSRLMFLSMVPTVGCR